ncbi:MAG: DUF2336 domain-containing protein [Alphaproteobacteria bacterium]|nr:DUF2336 domain-containing protein [Alphaproteobacteria bacterium]
MSSNLLDLKSLAENRASFARSALFDRVAGMLFESEGELSPEVRTLIDQILTGLIHQVEADVRKKVAGRLANLESAPRELVKLLASDEFEIAAPILYHSPVLTTEDLIAIVKAKSPEHREAIAKRANVPPDVVSALVAVKEPRVIESLLANSGAVIPRAVFHDLVALAERTSSLCKPLTERRDLPKDLAHQMFWFASAALRQVIVQRFSIDAKDLDGVLAEVLAEKRLTARPGSGNRSYWNAGEVSALVGKAKARDVPGFTKALAVVTGVDMVTAEKIVSDMGGEPLAVACKSVGADKSQFTTIFLQLDFDRFGKPRPLSFLDGVARMYDVIPQAKARAMMQLWGLQGAATAA